MTAVTVSPKFQIVIPKEVRESMGIISGHKIQMLTYQPIKPIKEMRGYLKGISTEITKEEDRL